MPPTPAEPFARRRRVDAGEQRDDRDLRVAVRPRRAPLGLIGRRRRSPAATIRRARARELLVRGATSTIRFPKVFPSRIIVTVEIVFRTSFCAVPALSRVEPATNSGPTTTAISCSAPRASSESVDADDRDASARRPRRPPRARRATYGVRPLALTPTTASAAETPSASTRAAPGVGVVLGRLALGRRQALPATSATTWPGAVEKVVSHSAASSAAMPAGRAGADVDQPAAGARGASTIASIAAASSGRRGRPRPAPSRPRRSSARRAPTSSARS